MDALSEIMRAVRLEGALLFNAELAAPWCIASPASAEIAPVVAIGTGSLIPFYFVAEGRAFVRVSGAPDVALEAGDVVLLPHGDAHVLANGRPEDPVDVVRAFGAHLRGRRDVARLGSGDDEITRVICGYLACEPRWCELVVSGLPSIVRVRLACEPADVWLEHAIRCSVAESFGSHGGGGVVLSKLSEIVFVEVLRRHVLAPGVDHIGWLAGARDPYVGPALALMHQEPARPWSVSELSTAVGLSQSSLAERFRHFLLMSPMAYLARWRVTLGAEILASSEDSVSSVASSVGYASETAFTRAFRREFDCPPARFRRSRVEVTARPDGARRRQAVTYATRSSSVVPDPSGTASSSSAASAPRFTQ